MNVFLVKGHNPDIIQPKDKQEKHISINQIFYNSIFFCFP
jgi:hypothetical protein